METTKNADALYYGDDYQARSFIRKTFASQIEPILKEQGYIKAGSSFLRVYGKQLLQSISFIYNMRNICCLTVNIQPLYNVYYSKQQWDMEWVDIRDPKDSSSITIEYLAGLKLGKDSYNSYFYDYLKDRSKASYDKVAAQTIELLKNDTILKLNEVVTGNDYIQFVKGLWRKPFSDDLNTIFLSPLIAEGRYEEAEVIAVRYAEESDEGLRKRITDIQDKIGQLKASFDTNKDSRYTKYITRSLKEYEDILPYCIADREKKLQKNTYVIDLIRSVDENGIKQMLNEALTMSYSSLEKRVKSLVKAYPVKYF